MERKYNLGQRCIAYILLISFLLQSCGTYNQNNPIVPKAAAEEGRMQIIHVDSEEQQRMETVLTYPRESMEERAIDSSSGKGENLPISLHQAVLDGDIELVLTLLPTIYVNTPDSQGNTLLHLAVQQDNLDLVKLLVGAQADIHAKNTAGLSPLEIANQKGNPPIIKELAAVSSNSMSLVKLLFHWDYENIGKKRILAYVPMKDKGHLRETCVEIGWKLLEKDIFHLSLTPDRLQDIRLQDYPRLYPHVQQAHSITFQPVPADAIVQHADDLQTILKDSRFAVKSVVFKGELEGLGAVREALPGPLKESLLLPESLAKEEAAEVSRLLTDLKDKDKGVRSNAVEALVKIGTSEVIEGLFATLKDQEPDTRGSARDALVKIGTAEVVNKFVTAAEDENMYVRRNTARALGALKVNTPEAIKGNM